MLSGEGDRVRAGGVRMGQNGLTLVTVGAAIVGVAYGMARFALGLATPRIIEDGVATEAHVGYASSLSYLTYVVACLASSVWLKSGRWRLSILAAALSVLGGCSLVAVSTSAGVLIAGVGLAGAAAGFTSGAVAYRLVRALPEHAEARGQAIANAGTGLGVAVSTLLLLLTNSWRAVYLAAVVLAPTFCIWFCVSRGAAAVNSRDDTDVDEQRGRWSTLAVSIALTILMGAGSSVYWAYGRSVAESQTGLDQVQSLLFWGLIGVAAIGGSFSGDLAKRLGTTKSWAITSMILAVAIILLPFSTAVGTTIISGVLFGLVYTVMCGLTIELGREAWAGAVGSATSILFATIAVGQAAGSFASGVLVESFGLPTLFVAGGLTVAAGMPLVWMRSKHLQIEPTR